VAGLTFPGWRVVAGAKGSRAKSISARWAPAHTRKDDRIGKGSEKLMNDRPFCDIALHLSQSEKFVRPVTLTSRRASP
jgi:hypothetical protein